MAQGLDSSWQDEGKPHGVEPGADSGKKTRAMGSRRIFPPQFKLLVLDSYRSDVDCRGNQRATARKFNIHRRQIQKWLQCEPHLRSAVEDTTKPHPAPLKLAHSGLVKCDKNQIYGQMEALGGGGMVGENMALNRSAAVQARLGDAQENRLTLVGTKPDPKVMHHAADKLEARNLKLVAQKLYPRSLALGLSLEASPPAALQGFRPFARPDTASPSFNTDVPLDLKNKSRLEPGGLLPSECHFNEASGRISERYGQEAPRHHPAVKVNMDGKDVSKAILLKENIEGQKFGDVDADPESLVQKYINDGAGRELVPAESPGDELLCARSASVESSSLEPREPRASQPACPAEPVPSPSPLHSPAASAALRPEARNSETTKSQSPKRRWMQECLHERESASPLLPFKQRVKLTLRSGPSSPTPGSSSSSLKSSFSIERLCSPTRSESPRWACSPDYGLPFPPPLILPHRAIPDLVTLHFKPEVADSPGPAKPDSCSSSSSFEDADMLDMRLKEERLSDSEDGSEVDVLSTTPVEKKTFDFPGYHNGKRRSFSVQFKLSVLDAFYNDKDCNKNQRATARKFDINRRQVQKWLSQEKELRCEGMSKGGKYLQQRQRLGGEECTQCPQHCSKRRRLDSTIEVNVKHCSDGHCLTQTVAADCEAKTDFVLRDSHAHFFEADLRNVNIYDNYLIPENNNVLAVYRDPLVGWPAVNTSAFSVPNLHYMSWYNFDLCHEKRHYISH